MSSGVSAVIPTKSHVAGLMAVLGGVLGGVLADHSVRHICVVIDGDDIVRWITRTEAGA
ncbi:MAG: hypothetical protein ACKOCE_04770 [Acidimicrobiia bacterium]